MKVRKAVIPAAGLGTRMLPATKTVPKEMLPMVDKPVIQYIIEEAVAAGIEDILIVTNRAKSAMDDYFDYYPRAGDPPAPVGQGVRAGGGAPGRRPGQHLLRAPEGDEGPGPRHRPRPPLRGGTSPSPCCWATTSCGPKSR